jgi:hypothetical protein
MVDNFWMDFFSSSCDIYHSNSSYNHLSIIELAEKDIQLNHDDDDDEYESMRENEILCWFFNFSTLLTLHISTYFSELIVYDSCGS